MPSFKKIKILVLDCDGVLTNGSISVDEQGKEIKFFNVYDGIGINFLQKSGIKVAIISGRTSACTTRRAQQLKIEDVYQGIEKKEIAFQELLKKYSLKAEQAAYIGDDLMDLPIFKQAGIAIAVPNAVKEVLKSADYICKTAGGKGAVREIAELILKEQGYWDTFVGVYQ